MCVYVCIHLSWHTYGSQRATCWSQFSPSAMWVLGIQLESSGLAQVSFCIELFSSPGPTLTNFNCDLSSSSQNSHLGSLNASASQWDKHLSVLVNKFIFIELVSNQIPGSVHHSMKSQEIIFWKTCTIVFKEAQCFFLLSTL